MIKIGATIVGATLASMALVGSAAQASTILINFDQVTTNADVNEFYNGGTDSLGASGPNLGVEFINFTTTTGFGETSQPNLAYNNSSTAYINDAAGFRGVSFTFGFFDTGTFDVYSGLNGTGSLLGTFTSGATNPYAFAPGSVPFSGIGESITLSGGAGNLGIDDLALSSAVPEPSTWAMMFLGFAGLGFLGCRRTRKNSPALAAA